MTSGIIFDIREFTLHEGPGLRTTVFLKGCPLRCTWCYNPEGQSMLPQSIISPSGRRLAGKVYSTEQLAQRLNSQAEIFRLNEGGVTFSGGEPLMQAEFVAEVIDLLEDMHVILDTSGYGSGKAFLELASRCDLVYFDLKLIEPDVFHHYTGGNIQIVLDNLRLLSKMGKPFVIRVPLVPGITDSEMNLSAIAKTIQGLPGLERVDLLPYNRLAGAKYEAAGMEFNPGFEENCSINLRPQAFENLGLPWRVA